MRFLDSQCHSSALALESLQRSCGPLSGFEGAVEGTWGEERGKDGKGL